MASPICEKAISEAVQSGNALLKFVSPNDTGTTGAHQSGFYLPKSAWEIFTPNPPTKGANSKHKVKIEWNDGYETDSVITWYGQGTRSEYRLTRFGKDFPFLIPDTVGDLLVLVPKTPSEFNAYVIDLDSDIEEVIAVLGVQPFDHWAVYQNGAVQVEDTNDCLEKQFLDFAKTIETFPTGEAFSKATREMLEHCFHELSNASADDKLLEYYETEYRLFQVVERRICQTDIGRLFKDVDDFLHTAASIMNRRKSRAGRALENHVDHILLEAKIPHEMRPKVDGTPDIIIPNQRAYLDAEYPVEKLLVVGVKTTCKDRWRQVLNEGRRVPNKHILTLQQGISLSQLTEMHQAGITLIVPEKLKNKYPMDHPLKILSVEDFVGETQKILAA